MKHNKKILALAVTSVFAGSALAATAVNMDSPVAAGSVILASEATMPVTVPEVINVSGQTGWGFSSGTAVFVRYDLGNSATFTANPTSFYMNAVAGAAAAANATTTLSTGGTGLGYVIYQITSANSSESGTSANITLALGNAAIKANASGTITLTQSVYDTSGNAVAGGSTGRLTTKSANLIAYSPSYSFSLTSGTAQTADASATAGIYKGFTGGISTGTVALGTVALANGTTALANSGLISTANAVLGTTSSLVVTGDFTAAANANGTYTTPALARVFLSNSTCGTTGGLITANSLTATTATFPLNFAVNVTSGLTTGGNNTLCLTTEGNSAIPAASYTAQFRPVGNTTTTSYTNVSASTSAAIGSIARNGGQLTSPWFSTATGYISRFVLTNTSSSSAAYTVAVVTESGNTATTVPAGLSGSVPANGMVVVNASDIVSSFSGASRAAVTFTFQTGRTNVNGVYQVTSPTGGVMSTTMVSPGTN